MGQPRSLSHHVPCDPLSRSHGRRGIAGGFGDGGPPWLLILPILLWGGRTMEGFGIVASPNLQELTPPIREASRADWTWRRSAKIY
jgi:hypothetical protein